jgi:hypothetical protein
MDAERQVIVDKLKGLKCYMMPDESVKSDIITVIEDKAGSCVGVITEMEVHYASAKTCATKCGES